MKKQWSTESEDRPHRSSSLASAAAFHARLTSMAINTPSTGSTHKHGFSWRRLLGGPFSSSSSNTSKRSSNSVNSSGGKSTLHFGRSQTRHQQNTSAVETPPEFHSIHSQLNNAFVTTTDSKSSSDGESNSLSSGRSETNGEHNKSQISNGEGVVRSSALTTVHCQECPLCLLELPLECFPELTSCEHQACYNCLQQYLRIEITESRVNICCPHCSEPLHPTDIRMILQDENLMIKYEEFLLRRVLVMEPDIRWCPAPDCGYAVIASGCASCPKLKCERPNCETYFCYHCKQDWHPNQTCDAARAQRAVHHHHHSPNKPRSASASFSQDSIIQRDDIKMCPCCKALIVKMDDGSCNHLTCGVCGTEFCWLCMKEISDLHYLSPSGCTFWGKKPWSRKKKIVWQLGMLVGAPVGIALIAGIAVPAIIIGVPVWVGRKLYAKYNRQNSNKHKRNLVVASGVIASILVSPILAAIAVGIGVPILLAYVYGVVPISLCRSGGCGVTTSASGVRIEFDEENEIGMGNSVAADGVSVDTAASHRGVVNPSIGEVSFGMSMSVSLGSGCHLERVGFIREEEREMSDRESASNTAIAGHSLTGSIASASTTGGPPVIVSVVQQQPPVSAATTGNSFVAPPPSVAAATPALPPVPLGSLASGTLVHNVVPHKLEVQVDVSSSSIKRLSVSSETASSVASLAEHSSIPLTNNNNNEHCHNSGHN